MFARLDEVDWSSMTHAYGAATDVPRIIRGLVSADEDIRDWAEDCMWGGIHHQGDVYDCTVAAVPFLLEAAAAADLPGRAAVVRLLASIGGADIDDLTRLRVEGHRRAGQQAVAGGFATYAVLLADPHPEVRRAVPAALLVGRDRAAEVVRLLQDRLADEHDAEARVAIVEAVGTVARRARAGHLTGVDSTGIDGWLAGQVAGSPFADVRMAALTELLRDPGVDIPDLVPVLYAMVTGSDAVDLRDLRDALGERVAERNDLLVRVIRHGPAGRLGEARWAASGAMDRWRGDYRDLMSAFADLLADPATYPTGVAALTGDAWPLAAPVAGAIAASIDRSLAAGVPLYVPDPAAGNPVWALAHTLMRLGDPRGLPLAHRLFEGDALPRSVDLRRYGTDLAPLVPALRRWLRRLTAEGNHEHALHLLWNLTRAGAAAEALPEVVALLPHGGCFNEPLHALAALGPAAGSAAPLVRQRLTDPQPGVVAAAATALGAIDGLAAEAALRPLLAHDDPQVCQHAADALGAIGVPAADLLPAYERALADDRTRHAALASLGVLGPQAAPLEGSLRGLLTRSVSSADVTAPDFVPPPEFDVVPDLALAAQWRAVADVAAALWRVTGDTATVLPVLATAWRQNRLHEAIVACWTGMGPVAASAEPLLRAELADPVRATYRPNMGWSEAVVLDEAYLTACEQALVSIGTPTPDRRSTPSAGSPTRSPRQSDEKGRR